MENFFLILAIFLGFFVQSIFGFAASLITFPIILQSNDLIFANGVMSIYYFVFSIILVTKNFKNIDKKIVSKLTIGALLGTIFGVYILQYGNPIFLKKCLGIFILFYVGYSFFTKKKIKILKKLGFVLGFLGGFFSGVFSAGGPFLVTYIYNKIDNPKKIRATIIGILGVMNFFRFFVFLQKNILTTEIINKFFVGLPFFLLALFLGQKIHDKINIKLFNKFLLFLLFLSGMFVFIKF